MACRTDASQYSAVAKLLRNLDEAYGQLHEDGYTRSDLRSFATRVRHLATRMLAADRELIGAEVCDDYGRIVGTVTEVAGATGPLTVVYQPSGREAARETIAVNHNDISPRYHFRVPGSKSNKPLAMAELLERYVANEHKAEYDFG